MSEFEPVREPLPCAAVFDAWRRVPSFFIASAASSLAAGASYVAVMLVAYARLGSAWAASAILLAEMLPGMLAGPLIGAWLDRRDHRRWAAIAEAVRACALAAMIVLGGAVPLLALALLGGLASTVSRPATFVLLTTAVDQERRMGATALWGTLRDGGMMLGPALAAGALVLGGANVLLAFTAALFATSAALCSRVRVLAPPAAQEDEGSLVADARASLRLMTRDRVLRVMIFGTGVIVLAAGMMNVAEVLLAQHDLRVGGAGFAAMVAVFGVGSVLGSAASSRSTSLARLKGGYVAGHAVLGAGLVGSALSGSLAVALATFFVTGFGQAASMTHDRGLLQELVPANMLARAHALIGTIEAWGFAGAALLGGTLASLLGARGVFAVSGVALIGLSAIAAVALQRPARQPVLQPA